MTASSPNAPQRSSRPPPARPTTRSRWSVSTAPTSSPTPPGSFDEATTVSLFGNRRIVWVRDCGARNILPAVQPLLDRTDAGSLVVIEAGDLKKGTGLRKKVEDHPTALAIPCYADTAQDIARLIDQELKEAKLEIDRDARESLEAHLGADRLASRGDYASSVCMPTAPAASPTPNVAAIVGDASAFAMDELIDAVRRRRCGRRRRHAAQARSFRHPPLGRRHRVDPHFQLLERARAEIGPGRGAAEVVERLQPPIFFRRRPAIARQLGLWSKERLARALDHLDEMMRQDPPKAPSRPSDRFGGDSETRPRRGRRRPAMKRGLRLNLVNSTLFALEAANAWDVIRHHFGIDSVKLFHV